MGILTLMKMIANWTKNDTAFRAVANVTPKYKTKHILIYACVSPSQVNYLILCGENCLLHIVLWGYCPMVYCLRGISS